MKPSTEDLHEKYLSGYTLDEISQNTGIGKWALYKRFQRMKKIESSQGNDFEDDVNQENIISIPDKSQTKTSKWTCAVCSLLILATVVMGFFLYRKYHTVKPSEETK